MALVLADRVRETSTTTGTGGYTLTGAVAGFRTFLNTVGSGNTCPYVATMGTQWEIGIGTVSSTGPTLARTTIRKSTNANAAVSWTAGTKEIRLDADADTLSESRSVFLGPTTLSGTTFDVTGIASNATRIEIFLDGVSTAGTSNLTFRIGDADGIETTGYTGFLTQVRDNAGTAETVITSYSTTFTISIDVTAAGTASGHMILSNIDPTLRRWMLSGWITRDSGRLAIPLGAKTLSSTLDRYQLSGGGNAFDAGKVSTRIWTA